MKIVEIRPDGTGVAELNGLRQVIHLELIEHPQPGQQVIVHAGFAIEVLDESRARELLDLFDRMAAEAQPAVTPTGAAAP